MFFFLPLSCSGICVPAVTSLSMAAETMGTPRSTSQLELGDQQPLIGPDSDYRSTEYIEATSPSTTGRSWRKPHLSVIIRHGTQPASSCDNWLMQAELQVVMGLRTCMHSHSFCVLKSWSIMHQDSRRQSSCVRDCGMHYCLPLFDALLQTI